MAALIALLLSATLGMTQAPADWEALMLDACESAAGFAPADAAAFASCELTTTDQVRHEGRSLVWSFSAAEGVSSVALSRAPGTLRGRGALGLWLKNPGGCPLQVGLRLTGSAGQVFQSDRVPIDGTRGWQQLTFLTDDVTGEGWPDFPLRDLQIAVEGEGLAEACTLYLDHLVAYLAPPEEVEVLSLTAPATARVGESIEAIARLQAPAALKRAYPFHLALQGGGVTLSEVALSFATPCTEWAPGAAIESAPVTLAVPAFLRGGEYTLRLQAPGLAVSGEQAPGLPVRVEGVGGEPLTVRIGEHQGALAALIGGTPLSLWGCFALGGLSAAPAAPIVIVPATAAHDPYGWAEDVWLAREEWNYEGLDRSVIGALQSRPEARVILRVFLEAPAWWDAQNPHELMLFSHGRHAVALPGVPGKQTYAAFSSKVWRADAAAALQRLVRHVEAAPYADCVVGYALAGGEDGRWRYWGAAEGLYADYSRPQRTAFIAWLRERHANNIRELRAKWQEVVNPVAGLRGEEDDVPPVLSWDAIRIPDEATRTDHLTQALLDPAAAPEVVDYNLFHAEQLASFIGELAAAAKAACEKRKLIGVSYGHVLDHARTDDALANAGHQALDAVITCPDIDLIAASSLEVDLGAGRTAGLWSSLGSSLAAHGKLRVEEVLPGQAGTEWQGTRAAVEGTPVWFPAAGADPGLQAGLRGASLAAGVTRAARAEVALVIDHYSLAYLAEGSALALPLLVQQAGSVAAIGAPYDVWLLDDLIAGRLPDYKLYVIPNAFALDTEARARVREHVARDGKHVVWAYAPGALDETLSGRTALDLTDLALGFVPRTGPLRVKVLAASHPLLEGLPAGFTFGPTAPLGPVFFAMATRGEPLGSIQVPSLVDKGEPHEFPGLISAESEDWTSIYSAAPCVPAELLRSIARHAGVHLYADLGDQVAASGPLLAVRAGTGGERRLALPQASDIRDLVTGERLASEATEFTVTLAAG
jgi:hypothetical protein